MKILIEAICILVAAALVCVIIAAMIPKPNYNFQEITYVVKSGDCLWSVADEYCPKSMDKRDYISLVVERNNLSDSVIYPGQCLVVFQSKN